MNSIAAFIDAHARPAFADGSAVLSLLTSCLQRLNDPAQPIWVPPSLAQHSVQAVCQNLHRQILEPLVVTLSSDAEQFPTGRENATILREWIGNFRNQALSSFTQATARFPPAWCEASRNTLLGELGEMERGLTALWAGRGELTERTTLQFSSSVDGTRVIDYEIRRNVYFHDDVEHVYTQLATKTLRSRAITVRRNGTEITGEWSSPHTFEEFVGSKSVYYSEPSGLAGMALEGLQIVGKPVMDAMDPLGLGRMVEASECKGRQQNYRFNPAEVEKWLLWLQGANSLSATVVRRAFEIYPQDESWSCGPHSAARALAMLGKMPLDQVGSFIGLCPKSLSGVRLAFVSVKNTSVGPRPGELAKYAGARHLRIGTLAQMIDTVESQMRLQRPMIILIRADKGGINLHYVNVLGIADNRSSFIILDPKNEIYSVKAFDAHGLCQTWLGAHMILF